VRDQLRQAIVALAQPAEVQLGLFPDFVCKADELALNFEDGLYELVGHEHELSEAQHAAVRDLESLLTARSGSQNAELWTEDAVRSHPFWGEVRRLATNVATHFGWDISACPPSPGVYVRSRR
jgi:hypothetical protein